MECNCFGKWLAVFLVGTFVGLCFGISCYTDYYKKAVVAGVFEIDHKIYNITEIVP